LTQLIAPTDEGLAEAARILRAGKLVAMPTETVYGLAGDARNDRAVASIFEAKGRPSFNPLIVHVPDREAAEKLVSFTDDARRLASAFWPGPLTLVLPVRHDAVLSPLVTAGLPTAAVRVPAHPLAQKLLHAFGGPIAAPSANPSGRVSPTRPEHVLAGLGGRIEAILDGGTCAVGIESTIVGFDPVPTLLRPGGVPQEALEACLGTILAAHDAADITAPGQLMSHYAPRASIRLSADTPFADEVYIGFGSNAGQDGLNLSPTADLVEAAANLFHFLRAADELAGTGGKIAVAPVPEKGLGRAINDRLRRAAAPRS
jgi:L-threonylcarbamoyladenylate synthase